MPNISVAQIVLDKPSVRALVGQGEAASAAKLVRVGRQFQSSQVALFADHKPNSAPVQGLSLLAYKKRAAGRLHPRALGGPSLDKPEFLRVQGMLRGESLFETRYVQDPVLDVQPNLQFRSDYISRNLRNVTIDVL